MRPYLHHQRNVRSKRGDCSCEDLRLQTSGLHSGPRPELYVVLLASTLHPLISKTHSVKYIALLAMTKIVPSHPYLIAEYQDMILQSVSDQDISIRMRALDLVSAMVCDLRHLPNVPGLIQVYQVNQSNLQSIVQQLLTHLVPESSADMRSAIQSLQQSTTGSAAATDITSPAKSPAYRLTLAQRILDMCSHNTYEHVTNFEWYISVLVDLAHVSNVPIGPQLRDQLVDVTSRVRAARRYAVRVMHTLLTDDALLRNAHDPKSCSEVLFAAAWICGEYCQELQEPQKVIPFLLQKEVSNLSPDVIAVYIQATTKIFGSWSSELAQRWDDDHLPEVRRVVEIILLRMREFAKSAHVEVQERVSVPPQWIDHGTHGLSPRLRMPSNSSPSSQPTLTVSTLPAPHHIPTRLPPREASTPTPSPSPRAFSSFSLSFPVTNSTPSPQRHNPWYPYPRGWTWTSGSYPHLRNLPWTARNLGKGRRRRARKGRRNR